MIGKERESMGNDTSGLAYWDVDTLSSRVQGLGGNYKILARSLRMNGADDGIFTGFSSIECLLQEMNIDGMDVLDSSQRKTLALEFKRRKEYLLRESAIPVTVPLVTREVVNTKKPPSSSSSPPSKYICKEYDISDFPVERSVVVSKERLQEFEYQGWKSRYPLHYAALQGDVEMVLRLIQKEHVKVDERMPECFNAHASDWAASGGHVHVLKALVALDADVFEANLKGENALSSARKAKHQDCIDYLERLLGSHSINLAAGSVTSSTFKGRNIVAPQPTAEELLPDRDLANKKAHHCSEVVIGLTKEDLFDMRRYANGGPHTDQGGASVFLCCLGVFFTTAYTFPAHFVPMWNCPDTLNFLYSIGEGVPCLPCCHPNCGNPFWYESTSGNIAAAFGNLHNLMVWVKRGGDIPKVNCAGQNVLRLATQERHEHIIRWLNDYEQVTGKKIDE